MGGVGLNRDVEGKTNGRDETVNPGGLRVAHLLMIVLKEGGQKHDDLVFAGGRGGGRVYSLQVSSERGPQKRPTGGSGPR